MIKNFIPLNINISLFNMTFTKLVQIYGVRMDRFTFYSWILNHQDSVPDWYRILTNCTEQKLKTFMTLMENHFVDETMSDEDMCYYIDMHNDIKCDICRNKDECGVCVYNITHDNDDDIHCDDFVIGIPVATLKFHNSAHKEFVDPDFQFPFVSMLDLTYTKERLKGDSFISQCNFPLAFYSIQNDCTCCS